MTLGLAYWILMLIWLVFGIWSSWPKEGKPNFVAAGGSGIVFVLLVLSGWQVFGAPLKT